MNSKARVLLLGFTIPDELAEQLFELDPLPAVQTHKFARSLARALKLGFGTLALASTCPVQSYPLVSKVFFGGRKFRVEGCEGIYLGFVNIIAIKHFTRFASCLIRILPLIWRRRNSWIFVHGVHSPFLLFGNIARIFGCKFAVVLTDPPGVILGTDGLVARYLKHLDAWLLRRLLQGVDAVLALAPDLANALAPGKPSLVFPGIFNSDLHKSNAFPQNEEVRLSDADSRPFTILYAGGLSAAYGVDRLIDAVEGIHDHSFEIRFFGRGDQEERIRKLACRDPRFFYGGFVGGERLMPEFAGADLLVNPRPSTEDFSRLSFPSKLIEYLATGRPVLTTRIKSIPQELNSCFFFIEDESPEGIRSAIFHLMRTTVSERERISLCGKKIVERELSEGAIGKKIFDLVQRIDSSF
ncbi:glycosyltransferase [Variovorax paradoxus]|uniref:glycosyltransferase n=1 Tax=Variovorax paradoxus TaxID=34073 RepID=UPI0009C19E55|nr:glycosyltransferase [Variovorax paradoxus]